MKRQFKPTEIYDLDNIVRDWAIPMHKLTKLKHTKIPKEHLQYNINWKFVKFVHKEPEYLITPEKSKILFKTVFNNSTDQDQEHTFKTEHSTRSTCEISLDKCFTLGKEINLSLKTPCEVLEAKAGFKPELAISDVHGLRIEESLTWGVDSVIKVPAGYQTTAELEVFERELIGKFSVVTEFAGKVIVNLTDTRDNSHVRTIEGDISEIMQGLGGCSKNDNVISFVTKGYCHFRFSAEPHVNVHQRRI